MKKYLSLLSIAAACAISLLAAVPAQAQATRTWVSGVGDDANPCSRTAPCKTFAGAISKTAVGGEINTLDPAGYGVVSITKSITIDGGAGLASILAAGTNGVNVNCATEPACTVTLRNLSINGASTGLNGIRFLAGGTLHVENVQTFGFTTTGIDLSMASPSTSPQVYLDHVSSYNNGAANNGGGLWVRPTGVRARVTVSNSLFTDNTQGIRIDANGQVNIRDSLISGNENAGIKLITSGTQATATIDSSTISLNYNGIVTTGSSSAVAYLSNSSLVQNVNRSFDSSEGGGVFSYGNNIVANNGIDATNFVPATPH